VASIFLHVLGRSMRNYALEPAGSVTPFVAIEWGRLHGFGKIERF
jgi:hypothetical protein